MEPLLARIDRNRTHNRPPRMDQLTSNVMCITNNTQAVGSQAPWGASPSVFNSRRQRGALFSLIINPKRQGITQLGIEEIKAKRALLQVC